MHHVHSNGKMMMVGNDQKPQTKSKDSKASASGNMKKSSSRSGRTSPGLNVKRFTIPKKQKELLNEVELDSSEYLREVLPIIQQGYRDSSSKNKFNYVKVQLIHNPALKKEFMEKKREMKDAGRNEKELIESYAFTCVQKEDKAKQLCKSSLQAGTKERHKRHCLGSPSMGVHVCRYSDVIHRSGVPKEGMLVLFKILKGKVKAVPLVYGAEEILEPTPNCDCHVAKTSGEELTSSASHRLFDSSELFVYDFDEDEVEFRKRPRNVCPYAVVHFTYSDTGIASSTASSSNFNRTPVASSNETTPTRNISIPDTVGIAVVAPCFPREEVVTQRPMSDADRPFGEKYRVYSDRSYRVWSGQLHNKNGNSCRVSLVSFGLSFLPCKMPEALHALKAVRIRELRLPTKVFTGTVPVLSRVKEAQANGKYYWYAELHSLSLDDAVYSRFLNYLTEKDLVLKKELGDKVLLYILPTGKTTQNLGLTTSSHPKIMHCLVESYVPMISHLTDITVKQPRHQVKPNLESAPIHDIEKDHLKRLRFQSSLAKLFYEQNRELKDMGVKGDTEDIPVSVTVPRQSSVEQEEPVVVTAEMSPASPVEEQVDENLNTYIPGSQHFEHSQSNQRTASQSNPDTLPVDNQRTEHPAEDKHDWNNSSNDWRSEHPSGGTQSWDRPHSQSNQQKEHSKHWAETKQVHANQDKHLHKQSRPDSETSNHHASQQSARNQPHSSHTPDHRLGHQPYEHQTGRAEHRSRRHSYERQSSKERASPQASPRGSECRSYQDYPHDRHPPKPPENNQYKRRSSTDWTDQHPSAKQKPYQDRLLLEAPKEDLPPQIKEVASKVHNMLTGGIDLGLRGAGGDTNIQSVREETDDEKIARMRATLQALVEEREKLAKNNTDKNSANPPTSVPPTGNEVLSSPSTSTDSTSEPKHPPPDRPKESIVEKLTESIVVDKPKEIVEAAGNGNETEIRMEGVEVAEEIKDNGIDKDKSDGEKDALKEGKEEEKNALKEGREEEKIVQETDSVKRKLEELEGPVKKKMRVNVPNDEAERDKHVVPKDPPVVPKIIVQKNVDELKTISKSISKDDVRDQRPKATSNQGPIIAKKPTDQKQNVPMTKTQRDQKKLKTVEKKSKSDAEEKSGVSKKSESGDKPSKGAKEISSASQMREYLERRHSSTNNEKKTVKQHISSASEMRMFLENPDKVSAKPRRIKSASEMRQFLNQSVAREKSSKITGAEGQKGAASDSDRPRPELEGKSRDDLLKNHDGDLASSRLQNFLTNHHQINWSVSQGLKVTVKRDMAGARIGPSPPGSSSRARNEEDGCTASITAVCHGSYRSMNGTQPDTSTKEGLAYQIRQVIHHSRPVKKVEPRKVKEIQKSGDQKKPSSPRNSTESKEQRTVESPANIPDGKKKGNSKSTAKKHPRNMKQDSQVKKNSSSKMEAPINNVESKDTPLQVPRKPIKLKIKKTQKSYTTTIPGTGEALEKKIATTKTEQAKDLTRYPSHKNKNKDKTKTGSEKTSGLYVSVNGLPNTKLEQPSPTALDKNQNQVQAVTNADGHCIMDATSINRTSSSKARLNKTDRGENDHHDNFKGIPAPVDITAAVRDMVKCLSAEEIRQLIGVYDDIFSRRQNSPESQQVPRAYKEDLDAMQMSSVESCGDTRQSGLQREDQDGEGIDEIVRSSPEVSVLKKCIDEQGDHPPGIPSLKREKAEHLVGEIKPLAEDHRSKHGVPFLHKMKVEHPVEKIVPLREDHPPKQGISFQQKIKVEHPVDDIKPLGGHHSQELSISGFKVEKIYKPTDDIKPPEDEDTLPYPLEPDQEGTGGIDQVAASCTDKKVLQNEACIDLYDSERWSELDEDTVQADASKEHTLHGGAGNPRKVQQAVDGGTTSLETTAKPVKDDTGNTAVSLASSYEVNRNKSSLLSNVPSSISRECKNEPSITKQTDIKLGEVSERLSVFERLSKAKPDKEQKTRNLAFDEKDAMDPEISLDSSIKTNESGDEMHRKDSLQSTSSLAAFSEASQSTLANSENKGTGNEEKRVSVFDRLNTKQPGQEPQKKRVSVFDRLYVPKPDKLLSTQKEPTKLERVSAFDRLSARKVTKSSTQDKQEQKEDTSSSCSSSKVKKEKTVKSVLSSEARKRNSAKATAAISSKIGTIKSKQVDEVVQKERQISDKNMPKDVLKSRKRELPKEDVPANKKYKLATKDQYKDQQKENVTSNKDDRSRKDPVKRSEKCKDLQRETVASSNKHKQVTQLHGKREEKDMDLQRDKLTSNKKLKSVNKEHARREEKCVDKASEKKQVGRKHVEKKDREHKRLDSKGRDSDHSSVSTIEDSDTIRQNILKRAKDNATEFSKYVVSGRYLKIDKKNSPSSPCDRDPMKVSSKENTNREGLDKDIIVVDGNVQEEELINDGEATRVVMQNGGETPPFTVHESYVVVDELSMSREINHSQVTEQPVHNISVIGGTNSNSMRPFREIYDENVAVTNGLPDDLPLNRIVVTGNNDYPSEKMQTQTLGGSYDLVSPEPTPLSPETKRAFEKALKASIGSPTKQDYSPDSPTEDIRLLQSCHQDTPLITNDVPASTSSYEGSSSTFTQGTLERVESYQDPAGSRKGKTSLKAPSSRQVHCGNRFHPYDNRVKTFQGHCHSIREPSMSEMISDNFCKEEYRIRKARSAAAARSRRDAFSDQARPSSSRFGSLNEMNHDEGMIQRAEEVEMTHSREGTEVGQRGDQLQVLDRQIEALTASGSDIQDYFILDASVYPIKNGDNSALSGVPPRNRIRRGRGRGRPPPPRQRAPPHQYQIHAHHHGGYPSTSRGYQQGSWNGPSGSGWSGPSQRSLDWWNRSSRNPSPNRFHHQRKGH